MNLGDIRTAIERWQSGTSGHRVTVAELTGMYNEATLGPALTSNQLGRALAKHGIKSVPDNGKRWLRVLDAQGEYLPEWAALLDGPAQGAQRPQDSGRWKPGTLLRVMEDGSLEVVPEPAVAPTVPASGVETVAPLPVKKRRTVAV